MDEHACASRLETLTKRLSDLRCDRVGLQNAIDLDAHLPSREEVEATLAEVRDMTTAGTSADHKILTQPSSGQGAWRAAIRSNPVLRTQPKGASVKGWCTYHVGLCAGTTRCPYVERCAKSSPTVTGTTAGQFCEGPPRGYTKQCYTNLYKSAPGRNRTCCLSVRSRTLCPVSYRRVNGSPV